MTEVDADKSREMAMQCNRGQTGEDAIALAIIYFSDVIREAACRARKDGV